MTIDERIAAELRSHVPPVDEQTAWRRIESAAAAKRRRRWAPIPVAATAAPVVVVLVGLVLVNTDVPPATELAPAQMESITFLFDSEETTLQGEEMSVTSNLIELGDGLVAQNAVRADNRLYVLAGRDESSGFPPPGPDPEIGVLAAFDHTGAELWRTELGDTPVQVATLAGDVWVSHGPGALSRIDPSDGTVIGTVTIGEDLRDSLVGAFGSVWVPSFETERVFRVHPDLSTTAIELPNLSPSGGLVAGAGAIWVPLWDQGVAVIDPDTNQARVIPADEIGHKVVRVAIDDDVVFVASDDQVTSIVDGEVVATTFTGKILFLGRVEGVFGVLKTTGLFDVLDDPMVIEVRKKTPFRGHSDVTEMDAEAWAATGPYTYRRVQFVQEGE